MQLRYATCLKTKIQNLFLWTIKKLTNEHSLRSMKNSITKQIFLIHFTFNTP